MRHWWCSNCGAPRNARDPLVGGEVRQAAGELGKLPAARVEPNSKLAATANPIAHNRQANSRAMVDYTFSRSLGASRGTIAALPRATSLSKRGSCDTLALADVNNGVALGCIGTAPTTQIHASQPNGLTTVPSAAPADRQSTSVPSSPRCSLSPPPRYCIQLHTFT